MCLADPQVLAATITVHKPQAPIELAFADVSVTIRRERAVSRAVLSIGSNLGDRLAALRSVVAGLGPSVVAVSSVYETKPWGLADQPDFLNAVVIADDPSAPARSTG